MQAKPKSSERQRRDWTIILIILLFGFLCVILAGQWAIRFSPNWKLDASMGSNLDPNSIFLTDVPINFIEPLDPAILTQPVWVNVFLTPGASFQTRTPAPTTLVNITPNTPVATTTPISAKTDVPSTITATIPVATKTPGGGGVLPTSTPPPGPISADLQVTKTDFSNTYTDGSTINYTIDVINAGPNNVIGAIVTDSIIVPQMTSWTWTCTTLINASGCNGVIGSSANFTDTVNIQSGGSIRYTVTVNISNTATGDLSNTVLVNVPSGYTDPVPSNNSATDTDAYTPSTIYINLGINKTDSSLTYPVGSTVTYIIDVTNAGPNDVIGAVVTDNIPSPLQVSSWTWTCTTVTNASGCTNSPPNSTTDFSDTVDIQNGGSIRYTVTANILSSATLDLTNTASVNAPAGYTDTNSGNNSSTDTDTPVYNVNLGITKDDGVTTYTPGSSVTYIIDVTNVGPANITGAIVSDTKPAQITSWTWVCTTVTNASGCDGVTGGTGNFTDTVDIQSGGSIRYTVTANTASSATTSLSNTASIAAPSGYNETDNTNNSATDPNPDNAVPSADLSISKTDNSTHYVAGATKVYIITVSNAGPSDVTGATVTDTTLTTATNSNIASASWTCTGSPGTTCTAGPISGNINDTVNIPAGASITYRVTAVVSNTPSGDLVNTASVTSSLDSATATDTDTLFAPSVPPPGVNIGPGDANWYTFDPADSTIILDLGTTVTTDGNPDYDLAYYELAAGSGIFMDHVEVQVSDGSNWYIVLYWGGTGTPDTNTSIAVPLGPPNPTTCAGEPDNCEISSVYLRNGTGVQINIDGVVPVGINIRYVLVHSLATGDGDGADLNSIEILP